MLQRLSIESRGVAVAIDGEVVRRSEWFQTRIEDGNAIEIVTAVAGG
jgi:sulfur carrier protein